MLLNTSKSNVITFTLRKTITSTPVTINGSEITEDEQTKLLGVVFDRHLRFSTHIETILKKAKPSFHALVQLRRTGVTPSGPLLFYCSRIRSILTYAAPCWFSYLSHQDRDKLERYQRLCLRIILPHEDCYSKRLATLEICTLTQYLEDLCTQYVAKLHNTNHPLHHLVPKRTYNKRTGRANTLKFRCSLLSKSLFYTHA